MRNSKRPRYLRRVVLSGLAFLFLPALAMAYTIYYSEYAGTNCRLIQSASSGWTATPATDGLVVMPNASTSPGYFYCPATLTTSYFNPATSPNFWVTNISFASFVYSSGSLVSASCQGKYETGNLAQYIQNNSGMDTNNYPAERLYWLCQLPTSTDINTQYFFRGYRASSSYFTN